MLNCRRVVTLFVALTLSACHRHDQLLGDLQSERPEARALALKALAEDQRPDDLIAFAQAAKDPIAFVRLEAINALAKSQDTRVVDLIGEMLGDTDESVQAAAAMALARIHSERARSYLTLQYGRRAVATRQVIVEALKGANVPGAMASCVATEANVLWERNTKALKDGALAERVGAAEELGKSGRPDAVNRLVPLLRDKQVLLAAGAARGLAKAGDVRAVPALVELLKENVPPLREAAIDALAELRDGASVAKLIEVAQERSPLSAHAVDALSKFPPSPELNKALCDLLATASETEATSAARLMRSRGGCPNEPVLDRLRNPASAPLALAALAALGASGKDVMVKITPFLSSSDSNVRRLAVEAVAATGDAANWASLSKVWDAETKTLEQRREDWIKKTLPLTFAPGFGNEGESTARGARQNELMQRVTERQDAQAKEANLTVRSPRPPREIVDDVGPESVTVITSLIRAVGELRPADGLKLLQPFVDESSPTLRAEALAAAAAFGDEGQKLAATALDDFDRDTQALVARALVRSGASGQALVIAAMEARPGDRVRLCDALLGSSIDGPLVPRLVSFLKDGGPEIAAVAGLLAASGARSAVDPLVAILAQGGAAPRRDVIVALGRLGEPRASDVIGRFLYDDSPDIRAAAAGALHALGAGKSVDALDALKGDYYRTVRDEAVAAMQQLAPEH